MKRLGGTDALFLSMETPFWHQHVGRPHRARPRGPRRHLRRRRREDRRAHRLLPEVHVEAQGGARSASTGRCGSTTPTSTSAATSVASRCPSPGGAQGARRAGRQPGLDPARPPPAALGDLVHRGPGRRPKSACCMKYHHCLLDGVAGASLATVLLDLEPDATEPLMPPPADEERTAGPEPSDLRLLADSLRPDPRARSGSPATSAASPPRASTMADNVRNGRGEPGDPPGARRRRSTRPIGPRRELGVRLGRDGRRPRAQGGARRQGQRRRARRLRRRRCAATSRHDALPEAPLVTGVPVSTRAEGDTTMDNQITNMFVSLATDVDDPVERLLAINRSTTSAKAMTKAHRRPPDPVDRRGRLAADPQHRDPRRLPHPADVAIAAAGQHARVERARPADAALHVRRQGHRHLPELGDPRGHGPEHHGLQLRRPARLRPPRRPRPRARPVGDRRRRHRGAGRAR